MELREKLLAVFQVEYQEHLERIRTILAGIAKGNDRDSRSQLEEAFRRAHSLKGAARAVDLHQVETLAHRLETIFSRVRDGSYLDQPTMHLIQTALDMIEDSVCCVLANRNIPDASAVLQAIDRVVGMESNAPAAPTAIASPTTELPAAAIPFQLVETVRVKTAQLDQLLRTTGQLLTEGLRQGLLEQELDGLSQQVSELQRAWALCRRHSNADLLRREAPPHSSQAARHLNVIDQQLNSLSSRTRGLQLFQEQSSWALRSLSEQLQQDLQGARLVPVESVFEGFRKMVRDLARDQSKEIRYAVAGLEVQADRLVLQTLKDPVMHLLRNAVCHGIESPEERKRSGKDATGEVKLAVESSGNKLRVSVEDDGGGIDFQKVKATGLQKGLLSASGATECNPEELTRLIFQPGFSTAEAVTELSGRGMGLSIVSEAVSRLQGEISIQLGESGGTALSISVPLTISTHRLLLVACRGQTLGIPMHSVERIAQVKLEDVQTLDNKLVLTIGAQIIPLLSLAHLLAIGDASVDLQGETLPIAFLSSGEKRVAVAVDAFVSNIEAVIKELDPCLARSKKISGGIVLGDGSIVLVLNPSELINSFRNTTANPVLKALKPAPTKRPPVILVVDDSITTRTLEKSILETQGYQVEVAVDGVEALNQLRIEPVDLVITDIQMPRMDGFALLEEMKKDPRLARIPVILVTSLESRLDQERGLALGADAYIMKRKFDQRELLDTIRQIV